MSSAVEKISRTVSPLIYGLRQRLRALDIQAKISLILVSVILPTFLLMTVVENKLTQPILEEELKQMGITSAKNLAAEIVGQRLLEHSDPEPALEAFLQEFLYSQPNILRMDVLVRDQATGGTRLVASNVEEDPQSASPLPPNLFEGVVARYQPGERGAATWDIYAPIEVRDLRRGPPVGPQVKDTKVAKRLLGNVHVVVSTNIVQRIVGAIWKATVAAAGISVVLLITTLGYFLRRTISNERLLKKADTQNLQLTAQLHEVERDLMNMEKLAVMGQLTASFAHEIGTPLNAIGGHLQLLREEVSGASSGERLDIIQGQLSRIEGIVRGFLQSTAKPASQRQLVDLNRLVDQTLSIVRPRVEAQGVDVRRQLGRAIGPLRIVPVDFEQILLNLINNSLDSLRAKSELRDRSRRLLEVATHSKKVDGQEWVTLSVYDTGEGIARDDLSQVTKPFFTTKRPGEGTGLGLAICRELAHKYGGVLELESKEGAWTRVMVSIPYAVKAET